MFWELEVGSKGREGVEDALLQKCFFFDLSFWLSRTCSRSCALPLGRFVENDGGWGFDG